MKLSDGNLRMFYSAMGPTGGGGTPRVLSAISTDGLNFTPEAGVRLTGGPDAADRFGIVHPHVIQLPDGRYRMYYDGQSAPPGPDSGPSWLGILSATSSDGLNWTKDPGVRVRARGAPLRAELVWSPFVERDAGRFKLYFDVQGNDEQPERTGVYVATSGDGLNFKIGRKPVLGLNPAIKNPEIDAEGGPEGLAQDVFLIDVPGGTRMFYWETGRGIFSAFRAK